MDFLQWAITTIVGILGIIIGRAWQKHDRNNQKDKEVLDELVAILGETVLYCRHEDFGSIFDWDRLEGIHKFNNACERPNFIFLDNKLEKLRKQLIESLNNFHHELARHSFREPIVGSREARIPKEHEFKNPQEYLALSRKLNNLADKVCQDYDKLVKLARQKL